MFKVREEFDNLRRVRHPPLRAVRFPAVSSADEDNAELLAEGMPGRPSTAAGCRKNSIRTPLGTAERVNMMVVVVVVLVVVMKMMKKGLRGRRR